MKVVEKKIDDLIEAEYNPRVLKDKQYKQLSDSLKRFGVVDPVLVNVHKDRKNIIIGGHQRTKVWKDLGNDTIPCIELNLTPEQEKELNVRLNKNTGEFDFDLLANYFDEVELVDWGFTESEFGFEENKPDYSALEEEDIDDLLGDIKEGVRKAIMIDFDLEAYEEANQLVKYWREMDADIGLMLIEKLKEEKQKL